MSHVLKIVKLDEYPGIEKSDFCSSSLLKIVDFSDLWIKGFDLAKKSG